MGPSRRAAGNSETSAPASPPPRVRAAGGEIDLFGLGFALPPRLDNDGGAFAATVLIWAGVAGALVFVVRPAVRSFTKRTRSGEDDKLVAIAGSALFGLLALAATRNSLSIPAMQSCAWLLSALFAALDIGLNFLAGYVAFRVFKEVVVDHGRRLAKRTEARVEDILIDQRPHGAVDGGLPRADPGFQTPHGRRDRNPLPAARRHPQRGSRRAPRLTF